MWYQYLTQGEENADEYRYLDLELTKIKVHWRTLHRQGLLTYYY
jgi:hypothetical protein